MYLWLRKSEVFLNEILAEGGQEPDEESPKKRHRKRSSSSTAVPEQSEEAREGDFEAVEGVAEVAEEPSSFDQALLDWFSLEKSCGVCSSFWVLHGVIQQ